MSKILVVEDSALIAMDLEMTLTEAGHDVIGPAATVAEAFDLLDHNLVDGAVLDVNLGKEDTFPVAARLQKQNLPFVFLSGYTTGWDPLFPRTFGNIPCLQKPIDTGELLEHVKSFVGTDRTKGNTPS